METESGANSPTQPVPPVGLEPVLGGSKSDPTRQRELTGVQISFFYKVIHSPVSTGVGGCSAEVVSLFVSSRPFEGAGGHPELKCAKAPASRGIGVAAADVRLLRSWRAGPVVPIVFSRNHNSASRPTRAPSAKAPTASSAVSKADAQSGANHSRALGTVRQAPRSPSSTAARTYRHSDGPTASGRRTGFGRHRSSRALGDCE